MSRNIDLSQPIDPADYEYLADRPWLYRGRKIDDLEFISEDEDEEIVDGEDEDEDEDLDESDEDEDEDVDLEELSVPQLRELAAERGVEIPKSVKKSDLIELLS